jgi:hypothetical protein
MKAKQIKVFGIIIYGHQSYYPLKTTINSEQNSIKMQYCYAIH